MEQPFHTIYYINLNRRSDRLRACQAEFAELGWTATRRIEAVDSSELSVEDWVRRGAIAPEASSRHSLPMYACIASHYLAWTEVLSSDAPEDAWCLILEDDFRPHPVLAERADVLRGYWAALPPDAGFVLVGCIRHYDEQLLDVGEPLNRLVVRLNKLVYSSHAYAMTKRFVRAHLSTYFPLEYPMDSFACKLGPLYALRSVDERFWNCRTPPDFYWVDRRLDAAPALGYAGLISVHQSSSDIQYGCAGIQENLARMREQMQCGNHADVCRLAEDMKPDLMRQLYPDLYLHWLDICITSFWYVEPQAGREYVERLLDAAVAEPRAFEFLDGESVRILSNLGFYGERYLRRASDLLQRAKQVSSG